MMQTIEAGSVQPTWK